VLGRGVVGFCRTETCNLASNAAVAAALGGVGPVAEPAIGVGVGGRIPFSWVSWFVVSWARGDSVSVVL
jgi:hypothetical protein